MDNRVSLRDVLDGDLPVFFEQQCDEQANHMAAFTSGNPADRSAFAAHWSRIRANETITLRTVDYQGRVAGYVASFERFEKREISYWIGRAYWGRGVATAALLQFLAVVQARPLYARAARDNVASLRVLEKCGFVVSGYERAFAQARGEEIEEVVLELAA